MSIKNTWRTKRNILHVLREINPATLSKIIEQLNNSGIILDEDTPSFNSTVIEKWEESCDDFLRNLGYCGGNLQVEGKYYNNHGAVYALFDEDIYDYSEAREYMDTYIQNYNINGR